MASILPKHSIAIYRHAALLPPQVWDAFHRQECASNIMYPHALKAHTTKGGEGVQLWMTCSTPHPNTNEDAALDFILSCTEGPLGSYPIFIFATAPPEDLVKDYLHSRLNALVLHLLALVSPSRVFSVFAPEPVTQEFAQIWSQYTGIDSYQEPYYAAKLTYCTPSTLSRRRMTLFSDLIYTPRRAHEEDIPALAKLCHEFATTSEPFTLSERAAFKEARYLVRHGNAWVLEVSRPGQANELASMVAVTRSSSNVAGITKVFTNPRWRNRGCAERLVRYVCQLLLASKDNVVLYVAHNNAAAARVYRRVGFQGLSDSKRTMEGVSDWLELGFDRDYIKLGHW